MNPEQTRPAPDDAAAPGADPAVVETMALEAVTGPTGPDPEPPADVDPDDPMVGRRIGAYRLRERIGDGGMGSVYRATRVEDYHQQVAVKLIKRRMDSEAIVRRFRTEIHVQAALGRHPNIAGLIDAGTADDGRPYFVMEYVDGRRIDEACDGRRLDTPARVRLFAQVCDAVDFAHRHAVIHRDLKPSNILVDEDGVPKLIDFGIAKLIDPATAGGEVDGPTRTGERFLTPEYASPEQVVGEPPTTASDVYALGVVLYRLLTGRPPYRLEGRTPVEVLQAVCEQVPERPSTAVIRRTARPSAPATDATEPDPSSPTPATEPTPEEVAEARGTTPSGLRRALRGDLEAIVLTAMRKEPERRYASAGLLADDLRRSLDGRPVRARGDSALYLAGKFVRRHAASTAAASVVVLAMAAGVVGLSWGLVTARRERGRAEEASREARRAVDQFFTRVSDERLLNQPGMHSLRQELLEDARRFYEESLARRVGDPSLGAGVAGARSRLARIAAEVGPTGEAIDQYRRAIAAWEDLLRSRPDDPEYQEELARTLNDRAILLMRRDGHRDEALEDCRRARGLIEASLAKAPDSAPRRLLLGRVLLSAATILFRQGLPDEAAEDLQLLMATVERPAAEAPDAVDLRILMAQAQGLLSQILMQRPGGLKPALAASQQAVDLLEAVVRDRPGLADESYLLANDLVDLSVVQQEAGKLDSALKSARRAVEVLERLDQRYPGVLNYRGVLGGTYNRLSDLHRRRSEPAESLDFAEKARAMLERLVAEHPEDTDSRIDLSRSYNNIGRARQQAGEPAEALRAFRRAVDLLEGLPELDPRNSYNLACDLALCLPLIGAKEGSAIVPAPDALTGADRIRRQVYSDRAIEVLRRAIRGGFVNTRILQADPDLDAIRDRDDFRRLVEEAEKQAAGKAPAS